MIHISMVEERMEPVAGRVAGRVVGRVAGPATGGGGNSFSAARMSRLVARMSRTQRRILKGSALVSLVALSIGADAHNHSDNSTHGNATVATTTTAAADASKRN
jgi:hypothetical protein